MEKGKKENLEQLLEFNEYKLKKEDSYVDILIGKKSNKIVIKSLLYKIYLNIKDLTLLTKIAFDSINECYSFIKNSFDKNKVIIKNTLNNNLILEIETYEPIERKEKTIEIILLPELQNEENDISSKLLELEEEIKNIKRDNENIKEENQKLNLQNLQLRNDINLLILEMSTLKNSFDYMMKNPINPMNYMNDMNNMNNMNPMNSMNNMNNNDKQKKIEVIFRRGGGGIENNDPIILQCTADEKVSQLIERYRAKANDYDKKKKIHL